MTKTNTLKPVKTIKQSAKELKAQKANDAISKEVNDFLTQLHTKGYSLVPAGQFFGNEMKATLKIVKIK